MLYFLKFYGKKDLQQIHEELAKVIEGNINPQFEKIYTRLEGIDGRLAGIDGRLNGHDSRFDKIEATMVTKSYLDENWLI